jgi:hypothetical protein
MAANNDNWMTNFTRFCKSEGLVVDETIRTLKAHAAERNDDGQEDEDYVSVAGLIDKTMHTS